MPKVMNNITCVSYSELVGSGILTRDNYDIMCRRGKIKKVVPGGNGREALVDYNSLPGDIKNSICEMFGDPRESYAREVFEGNVVTNYKAREFFAEYMLADGRFLPFDIQEKYSRNVEVLDALIKMSNDSRAFCKALNGGHSSLWANLSKTCNELSVKLGHDLPRNERRLRLKVKEYQVKGFECLISGKFLNKNSAKVADIEQEATIRNLLRMHSKFDNTQIATAYNYLCEKMSWEKITPSTVANYRAKWQMETAPFSKGVNDYNNTMIMLAKRSAPVLPLVYWSADGWVAELVYQESEKGVTTYHKRMTVVVVLDPCGKYPIGYAIGERESTKLIRQAFRNAVKHTEELFGAMHKVGQLQTDNYGKGGAIIPFYEAVSNIYTPASVGNAKAKTVEPYFKYLNKKYCQFFPNWSGFGITAKKSSQPNAQWINQHRHEIPTKEGVIKQIENIMEMERNLKVDAYRKAYEELPQEERLLLSERDYYLYLCEENEKTIRLSHEGLVNQINGDKRVYDCFDPRFRSNRHVSWQIKYDPVDRSKVMAINDDGSLMFMLEEKYIQPMALRDRKEGDAEELARLNQYNVDLKQKALDVAVEDYNYLADVRKMLNDRTPSVMLEDRENEMYHKLLITDSTGQHKDRKNGVVEKSKKLLAKQIEKEEKAELKTQQDEYLEYLKSKVDAESYLKVE